MPVERVIPKLWLPPSKGVQRIVMHWTAGHYRPSLFDRAHYHFVIDGDGKALKGPRAPGQYLPHVRAFNTGSVGLSIACMAGAVQGKTYGPAPLTNLQWERACQAAAEILHAYGLEVSERTLLCHSEVDRVYGVAQRGKWDIDVLPFDSTLVPYGVHRQMRDKAGWYLERVK